MCNNKIKESLINGMQNLEKEGHKITSYYLYSYSTECEQANNCIKYDLKDIDKLISDFISTTERYNTISIYVAIGVNYSDYSNDLISFKSE